MLEVVPKNVKPLSAPTNNEPVMACDIGGAFEFGVRHALDAQSIMPRAKVMSAAAPPTQAG
jgi:hypothetical protein